MFEQLVEGRERRDDAYGRLGLANLVLASVPVDSNKVVAWRSIKMLIAACKQDCLFLKAAVHVHTASLRDLIMHVLDSLDDHYAAAG